MRNYAGDVTSKIRIGSLQGYRALLLEFGQDPGELLSDLGLSVDFLNYPDALISTKVLRQLLDEAANKTGIRHFGLLLSQRQAPEKFGVLGYLLRHAPNLGSSINRLVAHLRTHDTGTITDVEAHDDMVFWRHQLSNAGGDSIIQQTELAVGFATRFIRTTLSETWHPNAVYFEHQAPRDTSPYRAIFRCPVHFSQTVSGFEFPISYLEQPLLLADPGLFSILENYIIQIEEKLGKDHLQTVQQTIQQKLEDGDVRIDTIAAALGLKRHELQRYLKRSGTNFQDVLDEVRATLARRYVTSSDLAISEIAGTLGYAESAVFTRAFRRWYGMTPSDYRASESING